MPIRSFLLALSLLAACAGGEEPDDDTSVDTGSDTGSTDTGVETECTDGDSQAGSTACGLNGRGAYDQDCVDGFWEDSTTCVDPDECTDSDTDAVACWEGRGTVERACEQGAWVEQGSCHLNQTVRVSVHSDGTESNAGSTGGVISADGRWVAFTSPASNLVDGDTNGESDVFLHDLATGETTLVSQATDGSQGTTFSSNPSISGDGRYVVFVTSASFQANDTAFQDIYLRDTVAGTTVRISEDETGTGAPSNTPVISADGSTIAFVSAATNLVAGDDNGQPDVFVWTATGGIERYSMPAPARMSTPVLSADGRYLGFMSDSVPLARGGIAEQAYVLDRQGGSPVFASPVESGSPGGATAIIRDIAGDGSALSFTSSGALRNTDTDASEDLYVYDVTGSTLYHEVQEAGAGYTVRGGSLTADGAWVLVETSYWLLNEADNNRTDVFARDRSGGTTLLVSATHDGSASDGNSTSGDFSADGRHAVFKSIATNIVTGDSNGTEDLFVAPLDL